MKQLAFVINVFREDAFRSGGERLFYELVSRAVQDGYSVDLYCTSCLGDTNQLRDRLNRIIFLGHPKDFKYPDKIELFYEKVRSLTGKQNYDSIIAENIAPPLDIGVLQGHSLLHYSRKSGFLYSMAKYKHINAQKKWLKTPYRRIIVPSNILKNELRENFKIPEERFSVIYPGVDVPQVPPKQPGNPFVFGLSAPSFEKKGGYAFLKALKQLKQENYPFRARIIYPKHKKNLKLQFLLKKYGLSEHMEFLPYQQDMQGFYRSIDCIVMPSYLETFGLVALEGMANRLPAVVSKFSGASEIIREGENGFISDDSNLAEKLKLILSNKTDYERISENACNTALKYNWEDFYRKFIKYVNISL